MQLTAPQSDVYSRMQTDWAAGVQNLMPVMATGTGKTVLFSQALADTDGPCAAVAHRRELVGQMSMALARREVRHRIVGPINVVKYVVRLHQEELGRDYYDPNSHVGVAGVDTITSRATDLDPWLRSLKLLVIDEGHHIQCGNKWGKVVSMAPKANGCYPTATPIRADGRGLGRHADGWIDKLVLGPGMRETINDGYLNDYRIFVPPNDLDLSEVAVSQSTGDYAQPQLRTAVRKSCITGDVVKHYLSIAPGKLGVTFAIDVEHATEITADYNAAGVPAEVVCAKTPDDMRTTILRRFKRREILQLVNVDLFGEGFDLPAIEVVSFARPIRSYPLYCQQFGRCLRPFVAPGFYQLGRDARLAAIAASMKPYAIIIDCVGNVTNPLFGLPDRPREWSLDRRDKRASSKGDDVIPIRVCTQPLCARAYERIHAVCPYCGHRPVPAARNKPEYVDGNLYELDAATLAALRGEVAAVDVPHDAYRAYQQEYCPDPRGAVRNVKSHIAKQDAQAALRSVIAWWAGYQRAKGRPDEESYKRFYWRFGIDVMSAQALGRNDAIQLAERVSMYLGGSQS